MANSTTSEIWIVPFFGKGHLFPSIELCKQIASRNYKSIFIVSSHVSNSVPSSLHQYPLVEIAEITSSPAPTSPPPQPGSDLFQHHDGMHNQIEKCFENLISIRGLPVCVVIDVMMGWTVDVFKKFNIPRIGFFTSGACSAAMEHAMWKAHINQADIKPGEIRLLPGLPQEMALSYSDMKQRPHDHGGPPPHKPHDHGGPPPPRPHGHGSPPPRRVSDHGGPPLHPPPGAPGPGKMGGPPQLGDQPPWMRETEGSIALMINTCDDLEHPFLNYLANHLGKPVWGVGPLLPEQFYKSAGSKSVLIHDHEIRTNRRRSNVTEDEVTQWLDSKTLGSVLYISFGTEVGPNSEEYSELAKALEATKVPFIWVIQDGAGGHGPPPHIIGSVSEIPDRESYFPDGLDQKVGKRGLIITGWAPQLLILSHPSTGGFLSHCGWNSTLEAIGCGIPILVWPIRGDQNYNAKLVTSYLKIGYMISDDLSKSVRMDDIVNGIGRLTGDEEMKKRAEMLGTIFDHGFPSTSAASLDAFVHLINQKKDKT